MHWPYQVEHLHVPGEPCFLNTEFIRLEISQSVDYEKYCLYLLITHSAAIEGFTLAEITLAFLQKLNATLMRTTGSVHNAMGGSFDSSKGGSNPNFNI